MSLNSHRAKNYDILYSLWGEAYFDNFLALYTAFEENLHNIKSQEWKLKFMFEASYSQLFIYMKYTILAWSRWMFKREIFPLSSSYFGTLYVIHYESSYKLHLGPWGASGNHGVSQCACSMLEKFWKESNIRIKVLILIDCQYSSSHIAI
jgi:hypothetical protein